LETLSDLNRAMRHIEANLAREVDIQEAARIAGVSEYHFRRMFSFLAGMPLGEYIRRRRLTLAALELQTSDVRVIDVAVKYGYESPDAFTRAFQAWHGVTPSEARRSDTALKAFPPMTFQLTIRGGTEMEYRIIEKDAFKVIGRMKQVPLIYEGVNPEIEAMWGMFAPSDFDELKQLSNVEPRGIILASNNVDGIHEGSMLDQWIGVATDREDTGRWEVLPVAAGTWAVFTSVGPFPQTLQSTWARIAAEWLPESGYEFREGPQILWNESPDTTRPDFRSEIWVPVVKR
jgi:AraC family transcriptional regulator